MSENHKPGWDAKVIALVAREVFGSYERMFEVHGWEERGENMMRKVQSRIVESYGSVDNLARTFRGVTGVQ
ncbi:hypothetical protein [Maricaulis sp.]|uniref:hypothetical protein n=1 Tax=Maricaulis sp. TaxID=1486257 RepID=UPI003A95CF44